MSTEQANSAEWADITVGFDVGGSAIKAGFVDTRNHCLVGERFTAPTPQPATPEAVAGAVATLATQVLAQEVGTERTATSSLRGFQNLRLSAGIPCLVSRRGRRLNQSGLRRHPQPLCRWGTVPRPPSPTSNPRSRCGRRCDPRNAGTRPRGWHGAYRDFFPRRISEPADRRSHSQRGSQTGGTHRSEYRALLDRYPTRRRVRQRPAEGAPARHFGSLRPPGVVVLPQRPGRRTRGFSHGIRSTLAYLCPSVRLGAYAPKQVVPQYRGRAPDCVDGRRLPHICGALGYSVGAGEAAPNVPRVGSRGGHGAQK